MDTTKVFLIKEYGNQGLISVDNMAFKDYEKAVNTAVELLNYQYRNYEDYEYEVDNRQGVVVLYHNDNIIRRYDIVPVPLF